MVATTGDSDGRTLQVIRRVLLLLLLVAFIGTFVELILLEHDEDASQLIPLVLLAGGTLMLAWTALRPRALVVALFRVLMLLFIAGGLLGLTLHFRANVEFQRDLTPQAGFGELFWKVMAAKAPPALAPGVLAQLGCLGLIYAYRLPVSTADADAGEGAGNVAIR